jgi:hypothetical protein
LQTRAAHIAQVKLVHQMNNVKKALMVNVSK